MRADLGYCLPRRHGELLHQGFYVAIVNNLDNVSEAELRSEPSKKNEYFFKYRDPRNAAETFRANGDINGLISHCNSQIERVMEIWNKNEDFRKQYVESNKLRRSRRLDAVQSSCTALSIVKHGDLMVVANVGDSRVVLGTAYDDGAITSSTS
uniref:protein-serine/threonine phosphatase n=1 Tax=Zea mays TaxID=4577 RepID=A0A804LGA2_MAIZE